MKCLLIILLVHFSIQATTYNDSCDDIIIKNPKVELVNLTQDPSHYSRRTWSDDQVCNHIKKFKKIFHTDPLSGSKISYKLHWDNPHKNSTASAQQNEYLISIYGGLFNDVKITSDAFYALLCHELGHISGGTPQTRERKIESANEINLSEGLADYFMTHKCLKKLARKNILTNNTSNKRTDHICEEYDKKCQLILGASLDFMYYLDNNNTDFETSSSKITTPSDLINNNYPELLCRFDIAISGFLCSKKSKYPCGHNNLGHLLIQKPQPNSPPGCFYRYKFEA